MQTGPFRPGNREKRLPGLFFAGSGTTPGVGVPMVLISGKLAATRVREYAP
jgi:phytoene desaturase